MHRFRRGLDLPITGRPEQHIDSAGRVSRLGVLAADHPGLRAALAVDVGDPVRVGQLLFEDKSLAGVRFTSPGHGRVAAIHRGERRALQSIVIELDGRGHDQVHLSSFSGRGAAGLGEDRVRELLLESGLWTALRARPFSHVADPSMRPRSIFVTAMDTEPLAPDVAAVLHRREADFAGGLAALVALTDGPVFVCTDERFTLDLPSLDRLRHARFAGPHPAGTAGLHIHTLDPVGRGRVAWHIGYQDVAAIGRLLETGSIDVERVVSLAGPGVRQPRLLGTRLGASTDQLTGGELLEDEVRVISGSVLSGRAAAGPVTGYLGRYHRQISVLPEWNRRELLAWAGPGLGMFSSIRVFASGLMPGKRFAMTTALNGSPRAIVPIGLYEKVMPFDIPATFLLKALLTHDVERAEELGCLELDEEDLALCTFVCSGKNEYATPLREVLTMLEREG
ncbi:MAG: Na(+)-translocating NADH-quinone reductase subunit A [Candidatus Binatia bacterium]